MSNVFLSGEYRDVETAIMLEKAKVMDIGNAVAYTDGEQIFINTDEKLAEILPAYNYGMLKWLLWHERYHMELKHHNRFFKYLSELRDAECMGKFHLEKSEVNIIMDILVHDSLSRMFPELVETALLNLAQMRNRNSLGYTFKTETLEEMLDEYAKYKNPDESEQEGDSSEDEKSDEKSDSKSDSSGESEQEEEDAKDEKKPKGKSAGKKEEGSDKGSAKGEDETEDPTSSTPSEQPEDEHDKTDWSKLEEIDDKEFITKEEARALENAANRLKRKKFKLAKLTQKLNGLATTTRERTYRMPSHIPMNKGIILKGKMPGKTDLYLVFDASGSMGDELKLFKEIITKAIPQALECPCEWFSGYIGSSDETGEDSTKRAERVKRLKNPHKYETYSYDDYYKGKFKDILPVHASGGYDDDGDRTIRICLEAEKKGYTPIGVTDGGGCIDRPEVLKQLKRTILVGPRANWLARVKEINPNIQIIALEDEEY